MHAEHSDKQKPHYAELFFSIVLNSINSLNNVEIRANDVHEKVANEALLRMRRGIQFGANILSGNNT